MAACSTCGRSAADARPGWRGPLVGGHSGRRSPVATFDTLPPAPLAGGAVIYGGRTLHASRPRWPTRWAITLQFKDVGVHAIVATPAGRVYVENSALLAIEDGRELWRWDKTLMIGRPLIGADGTVYVRDTRGVVYALSPAGRLRSIWRPEPVQREAHPWDAEKLWLADNRLVAELDSGVAILNLRARSPQGTLR